MNFRPQLTLDLSEAVTIKALPSKKQVKQIMVILGLSIQGNVTEENK